MKKEILDHKLIYLVLGLILVLAAFFRLYRVNHLLGFYYDQGRDALRVQDVLNLKDFPAIGPVTGIEGIFIGPLWYYLLTPFYWLGRGNPVVPAVFVSLMDVGAVFFLYWLVKEFYNRKTGLLAAFFWGFSYHLTRSARWLSHPPLLPFFTVLLIYSLAKFFLEKKEKHFLLVFLFLAIAFQLEIASAIFFLPTLGVIWLVCGRPLPSNKRYLFGALLIFLAFLMPQMLFEIKNNFLMTRNFFKFNLGEVNTEDRTWAIPTASFAKERLAAYFDIFFSKLEKSPGLISKIIAALFFLYLGAQLVKIIKLPAERKKMTTILITSLLMPLFCLLFFVGNYGRLWDYHLTGTFPSFIILFSLLVAFFFQRKVLLPIFLLIIIWFLKGNLPFLRNYLSVRLDSPTFIGLGNELQAIDWVYQDAKGEEFNVDVYVPPVVPYAYDYLFLWHGQKYYQTQSLEERRPLLYTLYEVDKPHPERLEAWLERQTGIGEVVETQVFGGITVQRRKRIEP